jgi:hypothetical protein
MRCGELGGVAGATIASANIPALVAKNKKYILSTGGAAGSFTCATDAGFETFINRYSSANLIGIDFDIEAGQTEADISNLVQRVANAQKKWPNLRYSFTIATLGGNVSPSLNYYGELVVKLIKKYQLSNYTINLMTMDYGSPSGGNCIVKNGECDMGASAVQAAINLNKQYGIPLSKIEITPMIGGNDTPNETFRLEDISVVVNYAKQNGIAGVHFWSLDVIRTAHRATLHQPVTPTVKQVHWASPKPS